MRRVLLTRKLAPVMDGVDLSKVKVGDVVLVPAAAAEMLIREGWAELLIEPTSSPRPQPPPTRPDPT